MANLPYDEEHALTGIKITWPESSPMAEPDPEYYAVWESLLIRALADNPMLSEKTAQLLHYLIDRIEHNPEVAAKLLHGAFNIAFRFTRTYQTANVVYRMWLAGELTDEGEPLKVLSSAMAKGVKK